MFFSSYSASSLPSSSNSNALNEETIKARFPFHYLIWENKHLELKTELKKLADLNNGKIPLNVLELKDLRQRTPLMLAVTLGYKECAIILLDYDANVHATDASGFNVLHEAVTSGDPDFIRKILERKEIQRYSSRVEGVPSLLAKICDTTDFYLEMKWEFTSWMPFLSRYCPHDTYKIYKSGSKVRVDTTLVGLDGLSNWQRGNISYIFTGSENGAVLMEIDHETKTLRKRTMKLITQNEIQEYLEPTENEVGNRLTKPIRTTFVDTERISFERAKAGFYGFRTDKVEQVNDYECKVYVANTVEVVTKVRTEHLSQADREARSDENGGIANMAAVNRFVGIRETLVPNPFENIHVEDQFKCNPHKLTMLEYFNYNQRTTAPTPRAPVSTPVDPVGPMIEEGREISVGTAEKDIGLPREMNIKTKALKAQLWISNDFPLSLKEQVLPVVDLMAISSSHFVKLRDFIAARLPDGFPVKIEIPLFHVLNARITFGNIFATTEQVEGVHTTQNVDERGQTIYRCRLDDSCFIPPEGYTVIGLEEEEDDEYEDDFIGAAGRQRRLRNGEDEDEADEYRQMYDFYWNNTMNPTGSNNPPTANGSAVNGKVNNGKQVTLIEALQSSSPDSADIDLKKAIEMSLEQYAREQKLRMENDAQDDDGTCSDDSFHSLHSNEGSEVSIIRKTLNESKQDHDAQARREKEEQEAIQKAIQLSLDDK